MTKRERAVGEAGEIDGAMLAGMETRCDCAEVKIYGPTGYRCKARAGGTVEGCKYETTQRRGRKKP